MRSRDQAAAPALTLPPEPTRLLVAGDSHGDPNHIKFLVEQAVEHHCEAILHLGDLGFYPKWAPEFLDFTGHMLKQNELALYFVEGNHEDYPRLHHPRHRQVGPFRRIELSKGMGTGTIWHIPRGARWNWRGIRFLGVGGAYSIDRHERGPGIDWFFEETLSEEDCQLILSQPGEVDVCVFHDAPSQAPIPSQLIYSFDARWNRELLGKIVTHVRPALILHAHYHRVYQARILSEATGASAAVVGLDCDQAPSRSWLVLDLDEARGTLGSWRSGEPSRLLPFAE